MQEKPWPTEESASPTPNAPALEAAKVACPACGAILVVPAGTVRRVAKCSQCKQKFWLPQESTVSDEEVARWMGDRESDEEPLADLSGPGGQYPEVVPPEVASALNRSPGAILMLRARAHNRLRQILGTASDFLSGSA